MNWQYGFLVVPSICMLISLIICVCLKKFKYLLPVCFWIFTLSFILFSFLFYTVDTIMGYEVKEVVEEEYKLEALINKTVSKEYSSGSMFLFIGSFYSEKTQKYFIRYAYSDNIGTRIKEIELSDSIYIKEDNSRIPVIRIIYANISSKLTPRQNKNYLRTEFIVPKGTIIRDFNVDLNK